jgi:DNA-binding GntR family transcriptional regulator
MSADALAELSRIVRASADCVTGPEMGTAVAPGCEDELAGLLDQFDLVMYAQSRNSRIDEMVGNIRGHIQRIGRLTTGIPGRLAKSVPEHEAIYEAIVQRDGAAAETLMRRHILSVMADQLTSIAEAQ